MQEGCGASILQLEPSGPRQWRQPSAQLYMCLHSDCCAAITHLAGGGCCRSGLAKTAYIWTLVCYSGRQQNVAIRSIGLSAKKRFPAEAVRMGHWDSRCCHRAAEAPFVLIRPHESKKELP
ncbi:hypothetical protein LSAT2_004139 [Lamellibrachia satsuma]|nr:hypothetical protein LSAT2_004139 [Lamellibrachia satsuma]